MVPSDEGFYFPVIDKSLCTDCGICRTACPVLNPPEKRTPRKAFAAWAQDESMRTSSSSGGVCSVLGEHILEHGGVITGCRFDRNLILKNEISDQPGDTARFRGSKYIQSYPDAIYRKVEQELLNGRTVLFVSTPCQVAGLLRHPGLPTENLITCDLVCHGVSSWKTFRKYLEWHLLSPDPDRSVIAFRDLKGWGDYYIRILEQDTLVWRSDDTTNEFIRAYLSGSSSNEACYTCPYARMERIGDLTLADFWGLGRNVPFHDDPSRGCSLILVNTEKGEKLLQAAQNKLFVQERSTEEARMGNGQLRAPVPRPPIRDTFFLMEWNSVAREMNYVNHFVFGRILRKCLRKMRKFFGAKGDR